MHVFWGIVLVVVVFVGLYYLYQAGFFDSLVETVTDITTGFNASYRGSPAPATSSYYHQLRIRFVSLGVGQNPVMEVNITAHPKQTGITVTGWNIKTDKGTYRIPKTFNVYSPSTADAAAENIFMRDGDRLSLF